MRNNHSEQKSRITQQRNFFKLPSGRPVQEDAHYFELMQLPCRTFFQSPTRSDFTCSDIINFSPRANLTRHPRDFPVKPFLDLRNCDAALGDSLGCTTLCLVVAPNCIATANERPKTLTASGREQREFSLQR